MSMFRLRRWLCGGLVFHLGTACIIFLLADEATTSCRVGRYEPMISLSFLDVYGLDTVAPFTDEIKINSNDHQQFWKVLQGTFFYSGNQNLGLSAWKSLLWWPIFVLKGLDITGKYKKVVYIKIFKTTESSVGLLMFRCQWIVCYLKIKNNLGKYCKT